MVDSPPDKDYDILPIFPGRGGLNDEVNPTLLRDDQASALRDVEFDRSSIKSSNGWSKLHRDLPVLSGLRFLPRPINRTSVNLGAELCPFAVIPFQDRQRAGTGEDMQIDFSFRLNRSVLTGEELTSSTASTPDLFGAPDGGEFQATPLIQRGGTDVEHLDWMIGVGVIAPEGLNTSPASADKLLRLFFTWYNSTKKGMSFAYADKVIQSDQTYHVTLKILASGSSGWFFSGTSVTNAGDTLPLVSGLDATHQNALYLCKPFTRSQGIHARAPIQRGNYDLTADSGTTTTLVDTAIKISSETQDDSYNGYFIRMKSTTNVIDGEIREVTDYTESTGTLTVSDAFSAAVATGDTYDLIPRYEPCNQDVTLQELRIWNSDQSTADITDLAGRQVLTDRLRDDPDENLGVAVAATVKDLVGYWPLSDDGGGEIRDLSGTENHGWFSSTPIPNPGSPVTLDGERLAIQYSLENEATFAREFQYNLGLTGRYAVHGRATFRICRDLVDNGASNVQDAIYETIFDWDDPTSSSSEPMFSLRWTHHSGSRKFYVAWNNGKTTFYDDANTGMNLTDVSAIPHPGRRYQIVFGVQPSSDLITHRGYIFILDGSDTVYGWHAVLSQLKPSTIKPDKHRISFGASVVGESTKGSGANNAMLARFEDVGWALRPCFRVVEGSAPGSSPDLDRWTTLDQPRTQEDFEPPISPEASLVTLTKDSTAITTTAGTNWASDFDSLPLHSYLLRVPSEKTKRVKESFEPVFRPRYVHINALTNTGTAATTGTISEAWDRDTITGTELRVAAYLGYTNFETALREFSYNSTPRTGENWALTDVFEDQGSLGQVDAIFWQVAILPSQNGINQTLFAPYWDRGLVKGWEKVRGLAELKKNDGRRFLVSAVNGSLYSVQSRWVRDSPFLGKDSFQWSFLFKTLQEGLSITLEQNQQEGLREERRTEPLPDEVIKIPDGGTNTEFKIHASQGTLPNATTYFRMEAWIKLEDLNGRRTIASRAYTVESATALTEQVNFHFYLQDGAPVFSIQDNLNSRSYEGFLGTSGSDKKVKSSEYIRTGEWFHISVAIGCNYTTNAFVDSAFIFFVNGQAFPNPVVTNTGSMQPSKIPDLATQAVLGAYGTDEINAGSSLLPISYKWGLGGLIAGPVRLIQSNTAFTAFIPDTDTESGPSDLYGLTLQEGVDIHMASTTDVSGATPGDAEFVGRGAVHLASGLSRGADKWSFQQFQDVLYGTNGEGPVFRFDGDTVTRTGILPPRGDIEIKADSREIRTRELGADVVGTCITSTVGNQIQSITGFTPTNADVGKLFVVPSAPQFGTSDGPDYIGVISDINSSTSVEVSPSIATDQATTSNTVDFMVFDAKTDDTTITGTSWISALAKIQDSTPASTKRIAPHGSSNSSNAAMAEAFYANQVTAVNQGEESNPQRALDFRGAHVVEIPRYPDVWNALSGVEHGRRDRLQVLHPIREYRVDLGCRAGYLGAPG